MNVVDDGASQSEPDFEKMQEKINELHQAQFVPGVVHCAKCNFELIRTTLHVNDGTTSAGNSDTEPCPNGCGPLWPVTWKDYATDRIKNYEKFLEDKDKKVVELQTRLGTIDTFLGEAMDTVIAWKDKADTPEKMQIVVRFREIFQSLRSVVNDNLPDVVTPT